MNNPSQTKDMNELNNIEHELGVILTLYEQNCMRIREAPIDGELLVASITHQLEEARTQILALITEGKIEQRVLEARKDELKKMVKEWGYGEYPSNDPRHGLDWEGWADYRTAQLDALLNTKGQDND